MCDAKRRNETMEKKSEQIKEKKNRESMGESRCVDRGNTKTLRDIVMEKYGKVSREIYKNNNKKTETETETCSVVIDL